MARRQHVLADMRSSLWRARASAPARCVVQARAEAAVPDPYIKILANTLCMLRAMLMLGATALPLLAQSAFDVVQLAVLGGAIGLSYALQLSAMLNLLLLHWKNSLCRLSSSLCSWRCWVLPSASASHRFLCSHLLPLHCCHHFCRWSPSSCSWRCLVLPSASALLCQPC